MISFPLKGVTIDEEKLSRNFFKAAGLDFETGLPDAEVLKRIGHLDDVLEDLYGATELS